MNKIQTTLTVNALMLTVLLPGAPFAFAQTTANVVDAVLKEAAVRAWAADDSGRFEHPTRPQGDVVLAQCFQDALASGDYPEIEAAFLANKAYVEASIPRAIAFAVEDWNELESTFIAFQLMNRGEDPEAHLRCFNAWVLEWGAALGDDTSGLEVSDVDVSAQAAVEDMFDSCLTVSDGKREELAVSDGTMSLQKRHEIEHECERIVYTFLKWFEGEHVKTADLFTEEGKVPFPTGSHTEGREAIREAFGTIDARKIEYNVLTANNLLITVIDEDNAKGFCYVTHYQHLFADAKREGQPVWRDPMTVTSWTWDFKRVNGEWKVAELDLSMILLNERLVEVFAEIGGD